MHFEILVEDQSGKKMLSLLIPKIIASSHTFNIHSYNGVGRIPRNIGSNSDASKRMLLTQLPKLLRGYGNTFANYPDGYCAAVILICDLDDRCLTDFRQELLAVLNGCNPKPETRFCFAIEEGEAWFLGDIPAIKAAYPKAKNDVLSRYVNDSVCGTWERLADAVYPGGFVKLSANGWQLSGAEKSKWAKNITPHMDVEANDSPSFNYFRQKMRELVTAE